MANSGGGAKLTSKQLKERQLQIEEEERQLAEAAALRKKRAEEVRKAQQQQGWLSKKGAGKKHKLGRRNWYCSRAQIIENQDRGTHWMSSSTNGA
jgi:hypothetical protein